MANEISAEHSLATRRELQGNELLVKFQKIAQSAGFIKERLDLEAESANVARGIQVNKSEITVGQGTWSSTDWTRSSGVVIDGFNRRDYRFSYTPHPGRKSRLKVAAIKHPISEVMFSMQKQNYPEQGVRYKKFSLSLYRTTKKGRRVKTHNYTLIYNLSNGIEAVRQKRDSSTLVAQLNLNTGVEIMEELEKRVRGKKLKKK